MLSQVGFGLFLEINLKHYALFAQEKLPLAELSCMAFPDAYTPSPH
jgi:hypothetical protein